ncbi:hypothetical protein [Vibrio lentus]|uniref:hypothetical protein n=1 Tax=Vibrio lentus TaxID=136468 RepID=UPI00247A6F18|nr:hypothetical protein [Vibrio lentus]WGS63437.1 hypothetical protein ISX51_17630 [Vibrio lentus]
MSHKTMALMVLFFSSLSQASTLENDEPLLKSLIERGIICPDLNYSDNQEALRIYLNAKKIKSLSFDMEKKQEIENNHQEPKTPKECIRSNTDGSSE